MLVVIQSTYGKIGDGGSYCSTNRRSFVSISSRAKARKMDTLSIIQHRQIEIQLFVVLFVLLVRRVPKCSANYQRQVSTHERGFCFDDAAGDDHDDDDDDHDDDVDGDEDEDEMMA